MADHFLDGSEPQPFWDATAPPRLTVASGDTVTFDCPEPCGQVTPEWTSGDLAHRWDNAKRHALVGPVAVEAATPGSVLQVDVLGLEPGDWGWSAHFPGFGLLADAFDFPYLHHWSIAEGWCDFGEAGIRIPVRPFCGCMGVAPPADRGRLDTVPPRDFGGNLDIRDLVPGSTLFLPVFVPGALFKLGDCHAAQGHGEVGGTGVEAPMKVTVRLTARDDRSAAAGIRFRCPPPPDPGPLLAHTAVGPDLRECCRDATRAAIDRLAADTALSRSQALLIASVAGDLKVNQAVDLPHYTVSMYLPESLFAPV